MSSTKQLLLVLLVSLPGGRAVAGEIKLRGFYGTKSNIVRLTDVAEFIDVPADQHSSIADLALFPAPKAGLSRRIVAQDVRELLSLYGLSLPTLRITGECLVKGNGAANASSPDDSSPLVRPVAHDDHEVRASSHAVLKQQLSAQIVEYLRNKDRARSQWKVSLVFGSDLAETITAMGSVDVSGGRAPWTGRQSFVIRDRLNPERKPVLLKADVTKLLQGVVLKRSLEAGEIVTSNDVEIGEVPPGAASTSVVADLAHAIGMEVKRPISAGEILQTWSVQRPLVVKRGELITVYSVAAGVLIKVTAKSLDDGGMGDIVLLEALESKKRFQGRVTGPQEAMVFVDSPRIAASPGNASSIIDADPTVDK